MKKTFLEGCMLGILIVSSAVLIIGSPLIFLYRKWVDRNLEKPKKITPHISLDNKKEIIKVNPII